jgi:DNA replication protein DnaC
METKELPGKLDIFQVNTLTCHDSWVKCSKCGEEYSRLIGNLCPSCVEVELKERLKIENENSRLVEMLGQKGAEQFTFDKFRTSPENVMAFETCRAFDPSKASLYLWGTAGSGKTHLAGAIVRSVRGGEMIKAPSLVRWFRLRDPREEEREIERLADIPVFVVDDLGVQKDSEHALTVLYEILDRRDMNMRHGLIITSNLPLDMLAKKMGDDRITSRIAGMCRIVKVGGHDHRVSK